MVLFHDFVVVVLLCTLYFRFFVGCLTVLHMLEAKHPSYYDRNCLYDVTFMFKLQ